MASETAPRRGRVLSVQSHVVSGYVGNKSAVFPLQLLGMEVDPCNSVQFSNHTGYAGGFAGERLTGEQLGALVGGLEQNGLLRGYTHLLTGYIGNVSFLRHILELVQKLRALNPGLIFVCDPVMGDDGRLYVPEELVDVYRGHVVAQATVLTPNQFEAELLSGVKIRSIEQAVTACNVLHSRGPKVVLLTSCSFDTRAEGDERQLTVVISATQGEAGIEDCRSVLHQIVVPQLDAHFTGTGDLIAALFLAWYYRCPEYEAAPHLAAEKAVGTVQAVLARTLERRESSSSTAEDGPGAEAVALELDIIGSKRLIEDGPVCAKATPLGV